MSTLNFFPCELCDKIFTRKFDLHKHYKNIHHDVTYIQKCVYTANCFFCKTDIEKSEFSKHLLSEHQVNVQSENILFCNENEFLNWKKSLEENENVIFTNRRGSKVLKNSKITTYLCQRSGYYRSSIRSGVKRKRRIKSQGSIKINTFCPAQIVAHTFVDGSVEVVYCKTHIGHDLSLPHMSSHTEEGGNKALLTKQDLWNIVKEYSVDSECVQPKDAPSVEQWVEAEKGSSENSVLIYKPQGVESPDFPLLNKDDFVLGVMNKAQAKALIQYGSEVICIDSIYRTKGYKFDVHTILVLDDVRQGFPCAFLFSSRYDQSTIELFLSSIKQKVGKIHAKVMVSDMAEVFYSAWKLTMGEVHFRLFCTWHIQKEWQRRMKEDIKNLALRQEVSKKMFTLQNELDEKNFDKMVPIIVNNLCDCPGTKSFGLYIRNYYVANCKLWALYFRRNAGINTNDLDRLHGIFEYLYMKGRVARRIDVTVLALNRFVNRKLFGRLIDLPEGKATFKFRNIRDRHRNASKLSPTAVLPNDGNKWLVFSSSSNSEVHTVSRNQSHCANCPLTCVPCNTCIHEFSCTCTDSCVKWNMCKHIHLVCSTINKDVIPDGVYPFSPGYDSSDRVYSFSPGHDSSAEPSENEDETSFQAPVGLSNHVKNHDFDTVKNEVINKFFTILNQATSVKQLELIGETIESLKPKINALKVKTPCFTSSDKEIHGKKNIEPQRKFKVQKKMIGKNIIYLKPPVDGARKLKLAALLKNQVKSQVLFIRPIQAGSVSTKPLDQNQENRQVLLVRPIQAGSVTRKPLETSTKPHVVYTRPRIHGGTIVVPKSVTKN